MRATQNRSGIVLRLACALALVFAAFAHRPAVTAADPAFDLAAYTLPDGSLADICFGDGTPGNRHAGAAPCEFCRIAGAVLTPQPPGLSTGCAFSVFAGAAVIAPNAGRPAHFPRSGTTRGPPAHFA